MPEQSTDDLREADDRPKSGQYDDMSREDLLARLQKLEQGKTTYNIEESKHRHENNDLKERLARLEREQQERERKALEEQGRWQELAQQAEREAQEYKSYKERHDAMLQTITDGNQKRVAAIPEDLRSFVPLDYDPLKLSEWLDANVSKLQKPAPPNIDAGARSTGNIPKPVNLTAEEKAAADAFGISYEDYAANKHGE